MQATLLFAPGADPTIPPLGIPTLAAYVAAHSGFQVRQRDCNLEAVEYLLSPLRLVKALEAVKVVLGPLDQKPFLSRDEVRMREQLHGAVLGATRAIAGVEMAKMTLRNPKTSINSDAYPQSLDILNGAAELISAQYYPARFLLREYNLRGSTELGYTVNDIVQASCSEKVNPYLDYYRSVLIPSLDVRDGDFIGISISYGMQAIPGFGLARELKKVFPNAHVCIGGAFITRFAPAIMSNPLFFGMADTFVVNEGEDALVKLLHALERGESLQGVPNLIYRTESGRVRCTEPTKIDINSVPTPDFSGLPLKRYFTPRLVLPLATSRGCYWGRCAFCTVHKAISSCGGYHPRKSDLLKGDITTVMERYAPEALFFVDESLSPKRLKDIAAVMEQLPQRPYWYSQTRAEDFTEELCRRIRAAGCFWLLVGFESATQRVQDLMCKGTRVEGALELLEGCAKAGIRTRMMTIVGFPGETAEEARATIDFLKAHRSQIDSYAMTAFILESGTPIAENPERFGISKIGEVPRDTLAFWLKYQVSAGLQQEEAAQILSNALVELGPVFPENAVMGHGAGVHHALRLIELERVG